MTTINANNFADDSPSSSSSTSSGRPIIDVSKLPSSAIDHRSPIWWGNALLLCIETSMFAIAITVYYYYRRNFDEWPPPKVDVFPVQYHPVPYLTIGTINTIVLLLSVIPMIICDRAGLRMKETTMKVAGTIAQALGIASIVLRCYEFTSLRFTWDENAYASITWTLLGLHLLHLVVLSCENGLMMLWAWMKGLDDKHVRDIRVTAVYWYWVVAVWLVLYWVIYWSPRFT